LISYDVFADIGTMKKVHTIHAAKTHLSRLVERAEAGEEVVIARGKTPVVRLTPMNAILPRRKFGAMRGRATVTRAFFEPLPAEEARWKPPPLSKSARSD
jgi:prevent-host-death family protein